MFNIRSVGIMTNKFKDIMFIILVSIIATIGYVLIYYTVTYILEFMRGLLW